MKNIDNNSKNSSFTSSAEDILGKVNKMISQRKTNDKLSQEEDDVLELLEEVVDFEEKVSLPEMEKVFPNFKKEESIDNEKAATTEEEDGMTKTLVSENTAEATSALINQLKQTAKSKQESEAMKFRSGTTVEDVVIELLKPHLSQWLDQNLPGIVKNAVEKEVKKLIPNEE